MLDKEAIMSNKQGCFKQLHPFFPFSKVKVLTIATAITIFSFVTTGYAQPLDLSDKEELKRRSQVEDQERQRKEQQRDTFLQKKQSATVQELPLEETSFPIRQIVLEGSRAEQFPWAQKFLNQYAGKKIGQQGINIIVNNVTQAFIDRGYITTRIGIPEQDLSTGTLRLTLIPGVIRNIRFADSAPAGNWKTAFPTRPGNLLNLRDIEQGLEQMKRLSSQDVDFQIAPGDKPGESDIIIELKRSRLWNYVFSLDDSGSKTTGKLQSSAIVSMDNLFGRNDLLSVSFNKDADREDSIRGTKGSNILYSFPDGYWDFTFAVSNYDYHQTIQGYTQTFLSSGTTKSTQVDVQRLIHRNQTSKTSLRLRVTHKQTRSYIDDTEIEVQRKKVTVAEAAILQRVYRGRTVIDTELAHRWGVPWFHAQEDLEYFPETTRYRMWITDVNIMKPVKLGQKEGRYTMGLRAQFSSDRLFASEFFSIGNRYTVRGFDGEQTLTAEKGWYIRNELSIPLCDNGPEVYVGLDYGRVYGPYTQYLLGNELAGMALGVRGEGKNRSYEVFTGRPVKKPEGYRTQSWTFGFNVTQKL